MISFQKNKLSTGRFTKVKNVGDRTDVIYHYTTVVSFDDVRIVLRSGGWETATTKKRMNQASELYDLGFKVLQRNYSWYILFKEKIVPFYDGIILER